MCFFFVFLVFALSAEARVYDYEALRKKLGYPSSMYTVMFGASSEEIDALSEYTGYGFAQINEALRKDRTAEPRIRKYIKNLDRLLTRVPTLPQDLTLFRGIEMSWRKNRPFAIGEELRDKGFTSASFELIVAKRFTGSSSDVESEKVNRYSVLQFYFQGAPPKGILGNVGESEALLPRNLHFKVMAKKIYSDRTHYLMQICEQSQCSSEIDNKDALESWKNYR